jgi:uncharacterized protein (TIGR03437 family)
VRAFALLLAALFAGTGLLNAQVTASPASLNFSWQMGAALPAAQSVSVKTTSGTPAWTATTPPGSLWLIATPGAGTLPGAISVQVNPPTLTPGTYISAVTVTVAGVVNPVIINADLTVTQAPTAPAIAPATLSVTFPGSVTAPFVITAGSSPVTFTATTSPSWLTVSPAAGAILPSVSATLVATVNPGTLAAQTALYVGKVTVITTSSGVAKTQTVTVNLKVNATPPSISSIWPSLIEAGSANTTLTIRGTGFYAGTTVTTAGSPTPLKVTVLSATAMLATLPATLLTVSGIISLTVTNPSPGGSSAPCLVFIGNSPLITGITNAASYAPGAISPGEIITIFGQNLGPTTPVQLTVANGIAQGGASGAFGAGGIDVTIDTLDAPIIYASDTQVSVQVPYGVQLGTVAAGTPGIIALTNGSNAQTQAFTDVVSAAPGIFTMASSGSGQALVLNYDPVTLSSTINSASTPARIGSTITIFLTGEGDYAAATWPTETGFMVPATAPASTGQYPQLSPLPSVTIGGVPAPAVSYAGPIPTCIMGLLQINVVIPTGATTGAAVPLLVTIGGTQTQANLTLAVSQ